MQLADFDLLDRAQPFWESRGFFPWSHGGMEGVYRRLTVRKGSMLGEVARYYADDYIVWRHGGTADRELVLRTWGPAPDLMVQRFVFLETSRPVGRLRRTRSFLLGMRGYLEIYRYAPVSGVHAGACRGMDDLAVLINQALDSSGSGMRRSSA